MKISVGQLLNHLSRANITLTMAPTADSKFPSKNLGDGFLDKYTKWRDLTADPRVTLYNNLIKNPGAEQGLLGWKKLGGGPPTSSTDAPHSGTKSFRLNTYETGGGDEVYQDILCRSGEFARVRGWTRGDAAEASGAFTVRDMKTGRYLQTDATWGELGNPTPTPNGYLGLRNAATYAQTSLEFQVEAFTETLNHLTTVRVSAIGVGEDSGIAYVDDLELSPATDLASIHGFNFPARMSPIIYSSDTGAFAGEQVARFTMTARQPAFYSELTTRVYALYWRLILPGEPIEKPWIAEWILTQGVELARSARYNSGWSAQWDAIKGKNVNRNTKLKTPQRPRKFLRLEMRLASEAEWDLLKEWTIDRCRGEEESILVAIPEMDTGLVAYGGFRGFRGHSKIAPEARDVITFEIAEDAFPKI